MRFGLFSHRQANLTKYKNVKFFIYKLTLVNSLGMSPRILTGLCKIRIIYSSLSFVFIQLLI